MVQIVMSTHRDLDPCMQDPIGILVWLFSRSHVSQTTESGSWDILSQRKWFRLSPGGLGSLKPLLLCWFWVVPPQGGPP